MNSLRLVVVAVGMAAIRPCRSRWASFPNLPACVGKRPLPADARGQHLDAVPGDRPMFQASRYRLRGRFDSPLVRGRPTGFVVGMAGRKRVPTPTSSATASATTKERENGPF